MTLVRKLLGFSYKDHITNEEVKARIGNAVGPHEDLTSMKRRKLKWFGHVTRSSGLAKTVLQGTVQRRRRRGRQRKRWEDNIKEWTGLEWNILLRKAENREEWRKLVVKSTVVPQRSHRLVGLVVRRPRKILGSNPACAEIFPGSSHTSDLRTGTPVATLPDAWRYRDSTGSGRPGVSIL